jgi:protocatechuate 3,4-dioxygenase beta subunit
VIQEINVEISAHAYILSVFYKQLIMKIDTLKWLFLLVILGSCSESTPQPIPDCEWCGAQDAPNRLSWETTIAPPDEPGEPLQISGVVYQEDGRTPAPDVLIYVYHTNAEGEYQKKGNETGNGRRHGHLRGWMKTDAQGRYRFTTIRPAAYQTHGGEPAHIHYTLKAPGQPEYWLDGLWFEGDPRIADEQKAKLNRIGGLTNITSLQKNDRGVWLGRRDIILSSDY